MIRSVTAINSRKKSLKMNLTTPEESGILITNIDGLEPPKADISMMQGAITDGSFYNSAHANSRNIVLDMRYINNSMSIEEIRHLIYDIFPVKSLVRLIVETDSKIVSAKGYVESNSVNIFSDKEGSQISILCESAWLTSWDNQDEYVIDYFSETESLFEFPFENNSLTENLIEFSTRNNVTRKNIQYYGEISTGFICESKFVGETIGFTIYNVTTNETFIIDDSKFYEIVGSNFQSGDVLTINTIEGEKSVKLQRGITTYNLLPALNVNSKWIQLNQGLNDIWLIASSGIDNAEVLFKYQNLYQGV